VELISRIAGGRVPFKTGRFPTSEFKHLSHYYHNLPRETCRHQAVNLRMMPFWRSTQDPVIADQSDLKLEELPPVPVPCLCILNEIPLTDPREIHLVFMCCTSQMVLLI